MGNRVGAPEEVARFYEVVLDVPIGESVRKRDVAPEISAVERCQPQLLLMVVGGRQVEVGEHVESWIELVEHHAIFGIHYRYVGGQRIVRRDIVDRNPRFRPVVRRDLEFGEDRSLTHVIVGASGVEPFVPTRCPGDEVAGIIRQWPRRAGHAPKMVELSDLEFGGDSGLSGGLTGDDVDRPADGGPAIERRVGAVDDLYATGIIDREIDHPGAVPRIGLRYAVDE